MICSRLDKQLQDFAASHSCHYSRYADDITFSTNQNRFPADLAFVDGEGGLQTGGKLRKIIEDNGFSVNTSKTRRNTRSRRQEVTGLVTNQFVNVDRRYVRNVRALLHAWRRFGIIALQERFVTTYDSKSRLPDKGVPSVVQVAFGRIQYIGAVRGSNDPIYKKLRDAFNELSPKKIRVPRDPWLTTLQRACWVIEDHDDILQGTAFFLRGWGLVTTAHCVGTKPFIYNPIDPSKQYLVTVTHSNRDIDLALLATAEPISEYSELSPQSFQSEMQYRDEITLIGYPEHAPGKELSIKTGEVQGFAIRSTIRRFNISPVIVAGNSGGPVFDRYQRVAGIAVTGVATLKDVPTQENGIIPVGALQHLRP